MARVCPGKSPTAYLPRLRDRESKCNLCGCEWCVLITLTDSLTHSCLQWSCTCRLHAAGLYYNVARRVSVNLWRRICQADSLWGRACSCTRGAVQVLVVAVIGSTRRRLLPKLSPKKRLLLNPRRTTRQRLLLNLRRRTIRWSCCLNRMTRKEESLEKGCAKKPDGWSVAYVSWHIRDKLWPMPKHGSINLHVHGNQKAR